MKPPRFTKQQIWSILRARSKVFGRPTLAELAEQYGVSMQSVANICAGKTYSGYFMSFCHAYPDRSRGLG